MRARALRATRSWRVLQMRRCDDCHTNKEYGSLGAEGSTDAARWFCSKCWVKWINDYGYESDKDKSNVTYSVQLCTECYTRASGRQGVGSHEKEFYCHACLGNWSKKEQELRVVKCTRPYCIFLRSATLGYTFCCISCMENRGHGPLCERLLPGQGQGSVAATTTSRSGGRSGGGEGGVAAQDPCRDGASASKALITDRTLTPLPSRSPPMPTRSVQALVTDRAMTPLLPQSPQMPTHCIKTPLPPRTPPTLTRSVQALVTDRVLTPLPPQSPPLSTRTVQRPGSMLRRQVEQQVDGKLAEIGVSSDVGLGADVDEATKFRQALEEAKAELLQVRIASVEDRDTLAEERRGSANLKDQLDEVRTEWRASQEVAAEDFADKCVALAANHLVAARLEAELAEVRAESKAELRACGELADRLRGELRESMAEYQA